MSVYIIGNGYSINLIKKLEDCNFLPKNSIDLSNLFSMGDSIPCKYEDCGYLSKDNCPHIWSLGIRSTINKDDAIKKINNIIASYILYLQEIKLKNISYDISKKCVQTYNEFNNYLRKLITYYNRIIDEIFEKMSFAEKDNFIKEIPFIDKIKSDDIIISYNYDIFFEKLLTYRKIKYQYIFGNNTVVDNCVKVYKPHGSINFEPISTNTTTYIYDLEPKDIKIEIEPHFDFEIALIIPPSGFIIGKTGSWVYNVRKGIEEELLKNTPKKVYIFGLSYDIVDRDEINEILSCLDKNITQLVYIDVNPSTSLDYIITQHFEHYCHKKIWR